jgi:molybdopterin-containing oxidoreductase family iron-sulfur binding subunit
MNPQSHTLDIAAARRRLAGSRGRQFWATLEELADAEGFAASLAAEFSIPFVDTTQGRRQFLKLMGASLLLGGLSGCGDRASDFARPYVRQPETMTPGVAKHYATALTFEGFAQPVVATTYDGRPTKLDGNPDHPLIRGGSDAFMQAAVLQLYDPDRSQTPLYQRAPATWADVEAALGAMRRDWSTKGGEGLRLLIGDVTSPTLIRQLTQFTTAFPKAKLHVHEPVGAAERRAAMQQAFGRPLDMHYRLDRCDVIVSLDDDLLGPGPRQVAHAWAWSQRRGDHAPGQGRTRLHVAESTPSATGAVAGTRLPVDASRIGVLALALAQKLGVGDAAAGLSAQEAQWVDTAAHDLDAHRGSGLLACGPYVAADVQAFAARINEQLGNSGNTVWYSAPVSFTPDNAGSLADLLGDMEADNVDTLIAFDCNPAYAAPADLHVTERLARVRRRIHVGLHQDETAWQCHWHIPLSHALESWGDARAVDGTATIIQPTVNPLYDTRSAAQVLEMLLGTLDPAPDAPVRATWSAAFANDFEARWHDALHDGFIEGAAAPVSVNAAEVTPQAVQAGDHLDIVFRPDPTIWDGRFANNGWLQELPKPLTTLTWDNVIAVSPALAEREHLSNGDRVEVSVGDRKVAGPAWVMPGQAKQTVTLFLGYGRRRAGRVGDEAGYDAYAVQSAKTPWLASGTLRKLGEHQDLAIRQLHHRLEGFDLVREVTAEAPALPQPKSEEPNLYPAWRNPENAWAMAIDLDLCIGCNACVAACTAENNVAVVGRDQVMRGREMHWLRVDRYYRGDVDAPESFFQPVPCMHCEKAPCEVGCPVNATVHSPDGINQMIYNRCIGTRTCSSYCPYKVRRFNWYDYRAPAESPLNAANNPDVTVRSRGIMEKCSYCTQRIQAAQVAADKDNRKIREGEVVTACQAACPTRAITFGNLNDPNSAVSGRRRSGRHYVLLEELGTRPRTTYLARWNDGSGKPGGQT